MTPGESGAARPARPADPPSEPQFAHNGNVDIAYEELGGAGGSPLLLIMGMGGSRFWWPRGLVDQLIAHGFHVVAYDARDAGESTHFQDEGRGGPVTSLFGKRAAAYSAEDMTDDATAVLDSVGWDSAHVFGVSMGGLVAQRMALRHPDRVRSITSMAAQPSDAGRLATARYVRFKLVAKLARMRFPTGQDGDIALGLALVRALAAPGYSFDEAEALSKIERDLRGVRDIGAQRRQAGARWHGGKLTELRMPALVMHGAADPLVRPSASRDTAAAIAGARLVILPAAGHDLPRTVWPQIASELRNLADRADARERLTG
jgi:pimeloyl-ACP methyl ester carboxylesterase